MSKENYNGLKQGGVDHGRTEVDRALVEAYDEDTRKHNEIAAQRRVIARRALTAVATEPHILHDIEVLRGSKDSPNHISYQEAVHEQVLSNKDLVEASFPGISPDDTKEHLESEEASMLKHGALLNAEELLITGVRNADAAANHKIIANENGDRAWNNHVKNEHNANIAKDVLKEL